jgi:hypothetical protein
MRYVGQTRLDHRARFAQQIIEAQAGRGTGRPLMQAIREFGESLSGSNCSAPAKPKPTGAKRN